jgi:iron complex outermembrane receptor protein
MASAQHAFVWAPVFALAVLMAPVDPARAAEPATDSGAGIEEVVVTARRREETVQTVPIPVTAMTGDQLQERGVVNVADIDRLTPNMDFQFAGSSRNSAQIFLRGIGQVNWSPPQDPKVGIYLNGVYLGRPQGSVFELLDIERVEVLRGPQGTLFGRNTTAGLVQVITKRPGDELEGTLQAGTGNDNQYRVAGTLNVPISDTLKTRTAVQLHRADGYVRNTATGKDWNDTDSLAGRASLLWEPSDTFDVELTLDGERKDEHSALGQCVWGGADTGAEAPPGSLQFVSYIFGVFDEIRDTCNATGRYRSTENDPDKNRVEVWGTTATATWDTGIGEFTSITGYRDLTEMNQSWGWGSDTIGSPSFLEVLAYENTTQDQWSQEFRLAGNSFDGRLDWVVGAYWFEEDAFMPLAVPLYRGVLPPPPGIPPPDDGWLFYQDSPIPGVGIWGEIALGTQFIGSSETGFDANNESWAGFFEATYDVTDALSVTAGVRYTEDDRTYVRTQTLAGGVPNPTLVCPDGDAPGPNGRCVQAKSFDELTPRFIANYTFNDNVMVYASWSKGYSSGGFNQDVAMRAYDPEVSKNWELGVKSAWLDRRLVANVTTFYNTYENQQITVGRVVNGQPTADLINAQEATLYGLEGEFTYAPDDAWLFMASFGVIDGEYEDFTVQDNLVDEDFNPIVVTRDLSDTEIVRSAPLTVGLSASYTMAFSGNQELATQLGWFYRDRTFNTLETYKTSRQSGYGLLDGRVTWRLGDGRTSVSFSGTNLLDKKYYPTAIDLSGGGLGTGTVTKYWAEPRRYVLELKYDFGG